MSGSRSEARAEAYGSFAYAYDEPLGKAFFAEISSLLDRLLSHYPPSDRTHLDLACGTGLAMEYFEQRGFVSIGVDASLPMLAVACQRVNCLVAGDLRGVPLRGRFGWITCLYDSLNHLLRRSDLVRAFESVRGLMGIGSIYLFDMNQPQIYRTVWANEEPFEADGPDYHLWIRTCYSRWSGLAAGRVSGWAQVRGRHVPIDEVRRQRAYSKRAIVGALRQAGLAPAEIIDFNPFPRHGESGATKAKWLFVVTRCAQTKSPASPRGPKRMSRLGWLYHPTPADDQTIDEQQ